MGVTQSKGPEGYAGGVQVQISGFGVERDCVSVQPRHDDAAAGGACDEWRGRG